MDAINKILRISSHSLNGSFPKEPSCLTQSSDRLSMDLFNLLCRKNGFYAFESALHVFSAESCEVDFGLDDWNSASLWRNSYNAFPIDAAIFFAEDIFGCQFCLHEGKVNVFNPETGAMSFFANSILEWAEDVLSDYNTATGYPLAHQWQKQYGKIKFKKRLLPRRPFIFGGSYTVQNLFLADSVEGMKLRGCVAEQIKDIPDGGKVKINFVD